MDNTLALTITDSALAEFGRVLSEDGNKGLAVRLTFGALSCCGPRLGLALDDIKEDDVVFRQEPVVVLADPSMRGQIQDAQGLVVDFVSDDIYGAGFRLDFTNPPTNGGSCGSGCGGCGGGCG